MQNINDIIVAHNISLKEAFKTLDKGGVGIVLVVDEENAFYGIMTDGDFRRAILASVSLDTIVRDVCNSKYSYLPHHYNDSDVRELFKNPKIRHIPVLKNNEVFDLILRHEFQGLQTRAKTSPIDTPVVIMAGGKGSRLDPFTRILPKPLIPIGDKTILETIIDKFSQYSVNQFYITLNYKSNIIRAYFDDLNPDYSLTYIHEDKPLGTAGALKFLEAKINQPFIVTNCDILIDADYADLVEHHIKENNDITIVASLKHYNIPYGICEIENGGELKGITEKPEYSFLVNTGMYVLNPSVLAQIPSNELFHATDLVDKIKFSGGKVGIYPINENAWMDTGEWEEYNVTAKKMGL
jgi:dTDP-glucose pyrophosphorylase